MSVQYNTIHNRATQCGPGLYDKVFHGGMYNVHFCVFVHLLTEAVVIFGMWHMLLTTSVAFDSLSDSHSIRISGYPVLTRPASVFVFFVHSYLCQLVFAFL